MRDEIPRSHTFSAIDACLFDMDGTLIDSTPLVERIWTAWATRHGLDANKVLSICHGRQSHSTMRTLAPHLNIAHEVAQMLKQELAATDGFGPIAGVHEFLASVPTARWAIVTSAQRSLAEKRLQVCNIDIPAVFVAGEDTPKSKPYPDGFLLAAKALNVEPSRCLVFEDSLAGLEAGRRAGMHTLQIGAAHPPASAESPYRVTDYRSLSLSTSDGNIRVHAALEPSFGQDTGHR